MRENLLVISNASSRDVKIQRAILSLVQSSFASKTQFIRHENERLAFLKLPFRRRKLHSALRCYLVDTLPSDYMQTNQKQRN